MESQSRKLGVITDAKDPATRNSGIRQDDTFEYFELCWCYMQISQGF